jgi:hypothetical protein
MRKKSFQIAAIALIALLLGAGLTKAGRSTFSRALSLVTSKTQPGETSPEPAVQGGQDIEQRARARHGWTPAIVNSVIRGAITFYNRDGATRDQANIAISRAYPDRLRIELNRNGVVETAGFDGANAWQAGTANLPEARARDIRSWLRAWPERLFTTRGAGGGYREAGSRMETSRPGRPWAPGSNVNPPLKLEQVEMEDVLGLPPTPNRVGDRRLVVFYVNRESLTVESARWLEPDNPGQRIEDGRGPLTDVRVDFGDWQAVSGTLWPFEIVHWSGGRVDYRISVTQVQTNQVLAGSIFHGL